MSMRKLFGWPDRKKNVNLKDIILFELFKIFSAVAQTFTYLYIILGIVLYITCIYILSYSFDVIPELLVYIKDYIVFVNSWKFFTIFGLMGLLSIGLNILAWKYYRRIYNYENIS